MQESYHEINSEMSSDDRNATVAATVQMPVTELNELFEEGNNNPEKPIDADKLGIDAGAVSRLTRKPLQKYRFIRSIGRGGMKMVLQVKDLDATRDVAMAILPDAAVRPESDVLRFVQEARITASLEHPNIVPVHDIGIDSSGAPYFTMKLLRGRTLASLIEKLGEGDPEFLEEYSSVNRLLRIFLKICYGVAFAHSRNVIHLDLKPENIQIGDFGEVLIMDWGLAKFIEPAPAKEPAEDGGAKPESDAEDPAAATVDGIMKGTPGYMAPEQAAGKNSLKDQRTDIYALGAILYALMTFKDPLPQKEMRDKVAATLAGDIIPPRERAPERDIPAAVEAVILKAMSFSPSDRYQSVKELRDEVNAFIGGYATAAEKASWFKRSLLFGKRHAFLFLSLAVIAFLLISWFVYMHQERHTAGWKCVAEAEFSPSSRRAGRSGFEIMEGAEKRTPELTAKNTLLLKPGQWLWFDQNLAQDLKLEITVSAGNAPPEFDIAICSRAVPPDRFPLGYTFRVNTGGRDLILRGDVGQTALLASGKTLLANGDNTFSVMRKADTLSILDSKSERPVLSVSDFFPPDNTVLDSVGIRAVNGILELRAAKIYIQTLPERPTPLLKGDILSEAGLYEKAFAEYLHAADLYRNASFADDALVKAYRLAAFKLAEPEKRSDAISRVRGRIERRPAFTRHAQIRVIDVLYLWRNGDYDEAFRRLDRILRENPESDVVAGILGLPHTPLPHQTGVRLLERVRTMKQTEWLDLSNYGLTSLTPLKGMKLIWLDCSKNQLGSLDGLQKMKLHFLNCSGNPLTDFSAVDPDSIETFRK